MQLHEAVDTFWIGRCAPVFFRFAAQERLDASSHRLAGRRSAFVCRRAFLRQAMPAPTTAPFSRPLHRGQMWA